MSRKNHGERPPCPQRATNQPDDTEQLTARVQTWATAVGIEPAVQHLIDGAWLTDPEFVRRCVVTLHGTPPSALVDWVAATELLAHRRHDDPEALSKLAAAIDSVAEAHYGRLRRPLRSPTW